MDIGFIRWHKLDYSDTSDTSSLIKTESRTRQRSSRHHSTPLPSWGIPGAPQPDGVSRSPTGLTCLEKLQRNAPRRHPNQMPWIKAPYSHITGLLIPTLLKSVSTTQGQAKVIRTGSGDSRLGGGSPAGRWRLILTSAARCYCFSTTASWPNETRHNLSVQLQQGGTFSSTTRAEKQTWHEHRRGGYYDKEIRQVIRLH